MAKFRVIISTTGDDATVVAKDGVNPKELAEAIFRQGLWVGNHYFPPAYLISATIEEIKDQVPA